MQRASMIFDNAAQRTLGLMVSVCLTVCNRNFVVRFLPYDRGQTAVKHWTAVQCSYMISGA